MQQVWKYELQVGSTSLMMPNSSQVLSVQIQHYKLCLWARVHVDLKDMLEERIFEVYGTGHKLTEPSELKFICTYLDLDGAFVGHVFERVKPKIRL